MPPERVVEEKSATGVVTPQLTDGTESFGSPAQDETLRPGTVLESRFRIIRMLGRGGMGEVYEAVDLALGTRVALKTVRLGQSSTEGRMQRFRREILLARRIAHPNVCRVFELHVGGPGEPPLFLSMDLLEGETLADRLRREGPLAEHAATELVSQIASGLGAAHKEGVLHRDLKPSNVMLVPVHGGGQRAVVTDFGIAQTMDGTQATTTWDGPAGTPAYMAPEQLTGWELTPASDLYSLGVLMIETTTGTLPAGPHASDRGERSPSAPRAYDRRNVRLSRRWRQLCDQCLAIDPACRPQSAEAFLRALGREARRLRRPSLRLIRTMGLVAAMLTAVVVTVRRPALTRRSTPLTVVVADLENATGDPQLDALSGLFVTSLEQSHALTVLTRASLLDEIRSLDRPITGRIDEPLGREVARRTGAQLLLVGTVSRFDQTYAIDLRALDPSGRGYLFTLREKGVGKASIPDTLDRLSDAVRRSVAEPSDQVKASQVRVGQAVTSNLEAYHSFYEGEQLEAEGRRGEALASYRHAVALDPSFAMAHLGIVGLLETRDAEGARAALDQARLHGATAPERERLIIRAFTAASEWRMDEAIALYQEVQRRFPRNAEAFVRAADLVRNFKGDTSGAIELLRTAADLESGRTPSLVQALIFGNRYDEAAEVAERFAARHPGPEALHVLTVVSAYQGRVGPALETARRAVAAGVPLEGVLLQAYLRGQALDEAEATLRRTIDSPELPQLDRRAAHVNLATVLGYEGRWKEAFAVLDRAVDEVDGGRLSLELLWSRVFLSGGLGAATVRSGTDELLRGGNAWSVCAAGILAYVGDPEHAAVVLDQVPRGLRQTPCGTIAEGVILWRRGNAAAGLQRVKGIDFGTEQLYVGGMLLDAGRPEDALRALEKFDRQTLGWLPFYAWGAGEGSYVRAMALERLGRRAEALAVANEQLRIWDRADPANPAVRRMRELASRLRARTHGRHVSGPRPAGQDHGQSGRWPGPSGAVLPPLASLNARAVALEVSVQAPTGR